MNYPQTLDYLFSALPMYHRIGAAAYKADLQPTIQMLDALGNPHRVLRCIHVAGTNGKGSVSHLLASILQEAGYRVGLYTSPHLVDFRERIRIDGQMIPQQAVVDFVADHKSLFEQLHLSFFEMTVGLAFSYFARQQVDIAVVEVGMGGRLDSTNVVQPMLSVITNIGFDHTQFLGSTLPQIATEKAGIIKPHTPVVVGETHPDTEPVFRQRAAELEAPILFADQAFCLTPLEGSNPAMLHFSIQSRTGACPLFLSHNPRFSSPLAGAYQHKNLTTLMGALSVVAEPLHLTPQHVADGIAHVLTNTHLQGRWQVMGHDPLTIFETAHNADGVSAMLQQVQQLPHRKLRVVYGCVNDKDFRHILRLFPSDTLFYFTQPSVPRRMPVADLVAAAAEMGIGLPQGNTKPGNQPCNDSQPSHRTSPKSGNQLGTSGTSGLVPPALPLAYPDVKHALAAARADADPHDLVLVTGSIFLVADALSEA